MAEVEAKSEDKPEKPKVPYEVKAGLFLSTAAGLGLLAGFGSALASAKKQDPKSFDAGMIGVDASAKQKMAHARHLHETGASLATRALGYGTLYAFTGCGILFFSIWKLMGVNNLTEFRDKCGGILPKIPKNNPPQSRTEFSGLNDLLQYIIDKDKEEKAMKQKSKES
eukprot:TRINITY_DN5707_c0_g1_i2.p1 TRINITY_DN5707_c0_g1~~TRINITY_DN5707_c0_g1_i2.p1  ORF type:complete len:168 (+),score=30.32 TRINITY_DN5707_c0_g1_i2:39-542(+)